jgi:hypothetical protein
MIGGMYYYCHHPHRSSRRLVHCMRLVGSGRLSHPRHRILPRLLSTGSHNHPNNNNNNSTANSSQQSPPQQPPQQPGGADHWDDNRVTGYLGHNFPDFIEHWNRSTFRTVGYALGATTAGLALVSSTTTTGGILLPTTTVMMGILTATYWRVGLQDMGQTSHAIRRNYPVLGNMRYILETIRPEIRQYLVEDDTEGKPMDRMRRSLVYQRAKNVDDTLAFGTRRDVYAPHYEWACHSMFPQPPIPPDDALSAASTTPRRRVWVGTREFGTTKPYSASLLNISAMSYGAISDNAILALSTGAKMGHFYHVRCITHARTWCEC